MFKASISDFPQHHPFPTSKSLAVQVPDFTYEKRKHREEVFSLLQDFETVIHSVLPFYQCDSRLKLATKPAYKSDAGYRRFRNDAKESKPKLRSSLGQMLEKGKKEITRVERLQGTLRESSRQPELVTSRTQLANEQCYGILASYLSDAEGL